MLLKYLQSVFKRKFFFKKKEYRTKKVEKIVYNTSNVFLYQNRLFLKISLLKMFAPQELGIRNMKNETQRI